MGEELIKNPIIKNLFNSTQPWSDKWINLTTTVWRCHSYGLQKNCSYICSSAWKHALHKNV